MIRKRKYDIITYQITKNKEDSLRPKVNYQLCVYEVKRRMSNRIELSAYGWEWIQLVRVHIIKSRRISTRSCLPQVGKDIKRVVSLPTTSRRGVKQASPLGRVCGLRCNDSSRLLAAGVINTTTSSVVRYLLPFKIHNYFNRFFCMTKKSSDKRQLPHLWLRALGSRQHPPHVLSGTWRGKLTLATVLSRQTERWSGNKGGTISGSLKADNQSDVMWRRETRPEEEEGE